MAIKNPKQLLVQATKLPAAIEAKLPEGAPKLSVTLVDATTKLPELPDFPVEIPDLPEIPELPKLPELPGAPAGLTRQYVTAATVTPAAAPTPARTPVTPLVQAYTQPIEGVIGTVQTRRGM